MTKHRYAALGALLLAPLAQAQVPVREMDARSMSAAYAFGMRGQNITGTLVPSHEVAHRLVLGYAPIPYASLQAGIGLERFAVEPHRQADFDGDYGFCASFGAALHSPAFAADILRATGGMDFQTFRSEEGAYRYSGLVTNPFLGLVASPTAFLEAAVGGRLHFVDGTMEATPKNEQVFANADIVRAYVALTLKSPYERAFLHLDMDFSPEVDTDWSRGPRESSVSVTVGAVLGWKGKSRAPGAAPAGKPIYFPAYPEMKQRQDAMAEELE